MGLTRPNLTTTLEWSYLSTGCQEGSAFHPYTDGHSHSLVLGNSLHSQLLPRTHLCLLQGKPYFNELFLSHISVVGFLIFIYLFRNSLRPYDAQSEVGASACHTCVVSNKDIHPCPVSHPVVSRLGSISFCCCQGGCISWSPSRSLFVTFLSVTECIDDKHRRKKVGKKKKPTSFLTFNRWQKVYQRSKCASLLKR